MCTINGLQLMKYIKFYNTPTVYAITHVRIYTLLSGVHAYTCMHLQTLAQYTPPPTLNFLSMVGCWERS